MQQMEGQERLRTLFLRVQTPLMSRTVFFSFFLFTFSFAQAQYKDPKGYVASDSNQESPAKYDWEKNAKFKNYTRDSYYLVMRDSIKIAIDVYVPKVKKGHHEIHFIRVGKGAPADVLPVCQNLVLLRFCIHAIQELLVIREYGF